MAIKKTTDSSSKSSKATTKSGTEKSTAKTTTNAGKSPAPKASKASESAKETTAKNTAPTAVVEKKETPEVKATSTSSAQPKSKAPIAYDQVAIRAYFLWQERGCSHGGDVQDWLQAQTELSSNN